MASSRSLKLDRKSRERRREARIRQKVGVRRKEKMKASADEMRPDRRRWIEGNDESLPRKEEEATKWRLELRRKGIRFWRE